MGLVVRTPRAGGDLGTGRQLLASPAPSRRRSRLTTFTTCRVFTLVTSAPPLACPPHSLHPRLHHSYWCQAVVTASASCALSGLALPCCAPRLGETAGLGPATPPSVLCPHGGSADCGRLATLPVRTGRCSRQLLVFSSLRPPSLSLSADTLPAWREQALVSELWLAWVCLRAPGRRPRWTEAAATASPVQRAAPFSTTAGRSSGWAAASPRSSWPASRQHREVP